jgi:hypothetical protein
MEHSPERDRRRGRHYEGRAWIALASVELTVTTAALLKAIGLLAIHFPEKFHLEAWQALRVPRAGGDRVGRARAYSIT